MLSTVSKTPKLKANIVFNAIYQIFQLIVPFVLSPYLSRVLTPDGIGSYSYAFTYVNYFIALCNFGITSYGTAAIAKHRSSKEEYSVMFWEIFILKIIIFSISIAVYLPMVCFGLFESPSYPLNSKLIYLLLAIFLLGQGLDITFLFQGLEKFGSLCIRNSVVKVLNIVFIFVFVQSSDDYLAYVVIMSLSFALSALSMFPPLYRNIKLVKWRKIHPFRHFIPAFAMFLPSIFSIIFSTSSKTISGMIVSDSAESGYLETALKLVTLITTLVNSLSVLMMSRISFLFAEGKREEIRSLTIKVLELMFDFALPCVFGLFAINQYFTPLFFGQEYVDSIPLVYLLIPYILLSPMTDILDAVYYVPQRHVWKRAIFLAIGMVFNLVTNIVFIMFFGNAGAAISTTLTQLLVFVLYFLFCRKEICYKPAIRTFIKALDAALIMFIVTWLSGYFLKAFSPSIIVMAQILIGIFTYIALLIVFREEFCMYVIAILKKYITKFMLKGKNRM